jgi:two-component system alkaline phosphatase synthesis response regulator PhoP
LSKKILVVDDEAMLVNMITMRLEANGYDVSGATDGLEGLSKAGLIRPDLIILDINMPGMDGYTMLKEIRRNDQMKDTQVIMLTASGKKRELFEKEGISDYITKPFDTEDFLLRVDAVLKKAKGTKIK